MIADFELFLVQDQAFWKFQAVCCLTQFCGSVIDLLQSIYGLLFDDASCSKYYLGLLFNKISHKLYWVQSCFKLCLCFLQLWLVSRVNVKRYKSTFIHCRLLELLQEARFEEFRSYWRPWVMPANIDKDQVKFFRALGHKKFSRISLNNLQNFITFWWETKLLSWKL